MVTVTGGGGAGSRGTLRLGFWSLHAEWDLDSLPTLEYE